MMVEGNCSCLLEVVDMKCRNGHEMEVKPEVATLKEKFELAVTFPKDL